MSVCMSTHISLKPYGRASPIFLRMLPVGAARSSSDGTAICYVLLVLKTISRFNTVSSMVRHAYS